MQAFLVALAMSIIKHYASKIGMSVYDFLKQQGRLKENAERSAEYKEVVDSNANREARRAAEDRLLD